MFNELTIRNMTISELERSAHMLGNINPEVLLDIFIERFGQEYDGTADIEDELAQAQDDLEYAERELSIANDKIESLEDEINDLRQRYC